MTVAVVWNANIQHINMNDILQENVIHVYCWCSKIRRKSLIPLSLLTQVGLRKADHSVLSVLRQHSSTRLFAINSPAKPRLHQLLCLESSGFTRSTSGSMQLLHWHECQADNLSANGLHNANGGFLVPDKPFWRHYYSIVMYCCSVLVTIRCH